eukprot:TRINITY_DN180_c3_g1_i1.p1 TRINITY_DN180_c3_g1~~TRINITY_DN180_c3_g1_i1.p1  ORF type:complete len:205 (+),score=23.03 TRINITY_DN180_c3_g1_i1:66-680(+)
MSALFGAKLCVAALVLFSLLNTVQSIQTQSQCIDFGESISDTISSPAFDRAFFNASVMVQNLISPDPCNIANINSTAIAYAQAIVIPIATAFKQTVDIINDSADCGNTKAMERGQVSSKIISIAAAEAYSFSVAFTFGFQHFAFARSQAVAQSIQIAIQQAVSDQAAVEQKGFEYSIVGIEAIAAAATVAGSIAEVIMFIYGCD